ncbi:hypothetical protein [Marinimicrobium agarilyticum]|uniref:hypothetical protein n=1 Tax=Marinimicrobium agarilyticum TaxID=306546 RepID=UPI0004881F6B|nr:hypothetical protein [Marinimicrobium agarilyticum]
MLGLIRSAGKAALCLVLAGLLYACGGGSDSVVSSQSLPTGEIEATIEVHADPEQGSAHASVQLLRPPASRDDDYYDGDDYVELGDGDDLWFTTGVNLREEVLGSDWFEALSELTHSQRLLEGDYRYRRSYIFSGLVPERVYYNGHLDNVPDGARYTVSLLRDGAAEALESTVVMPRAFQLLSPLANQTLSRSSDPVQLEWLPVEEGVTIEVDVTTTCTNNSDYQYRTSVDDDSGSLQIEAGAIDDERLLGTCDTTLTLVKLRAGQLDSAYAGGSISARQVQAVTFTTVD